MQAAGGHPRQPLAILGNELHYFPLSLMRSIPEGGFSPHLCTPCFQRKCEMEYAKLVLGQGGRHVVLAPRDVAQFGHGRELLIVDR